MNFTGETDWNPPDHTTMNHHQTASLSLHPPVALSGVPTDGERPGLSDIEQKRAKAREASRRYRAAHPERIKEQAKSYSERNKAQIASKSAAKRKANPEKSKDNDRKWRANHKEVRRMNCKKWQAENRDKVRNYRKANQDRRNEYNRKWISENTEAHRAMIRRWKAENADKELAKGHRHRARKKINSTPEQLASADAKIKELKSSVLAKCAYCEKEFPTKILAIEHIIPLAKGGPHSAENLTLACKSCNSSKGAKILNVTYFAPSASQGLELWQRQEKRA